jgi:hypothetical protein
MQIKAPFLRKYIRTYVPFMEARKSSAEMVIFSNFFPTRFSHFSTNSLWDRMFSGGRRYTILLRVRGSSIVLIVYVATSSSSIKTTARTKYSFQLIYIYIYIYMCVCVCVCVCVCIQIKYFFIFHFPYEK